MSFQKLTKATTYKAEMVFCHGISPGSHEDTKFAKELHSINPTQRMAAKKLAAFLYPGEPIRFRV